MVLAVVIRSEIAELDDTAIDTRREEARRRFRICRRADHEDPTEAPAPLPSPATTERTRAPAPRSVSRLADLRVAETAGRRDARRLSTVVAMPRSATPATVRIDWVRSEDAGQSALQVGKDGIAISGSATATNNVRARPRSGAVIARPGSIAQPNIAIGVQGPGPGRRHRGADRAPPRRPPRVEVRGRGPRGGRRHRDRPPRSRAAERDRLS
jgi:hypothetical protein